MEEIEKLKNLLASLESPIGACSLAQTGKYFPSFAFTDMSLSSSRVINSRTTDHMTHSLQKFSTYSPCLSNKKIIIVHGSLMIVVSQREIPLNKTVALKNFLHVRKLSTNLIFIHRPTNDLNCHVIFIHLTIYFRNKVWGRRLDILGDFIILSYLLVKVKLRISYPHHSSLKSHQQKKVRFGFFTIFLVIRRLIFLQLCFLYFSKK